MASILVIDDVSGVRRSIAAILERQGHTVEQAADASEGLDKARTARPDLVVTDILMPGVDGIETIERLRALPNGSAIKILAVSGGGSLVSCAEALEYARLVADGVLPKPFDNAELSAAVSALIGSA